jgi:glycosyltransferase involved in cell wall biosynthesis
MIAGAEARRIGKALESVAAWAGEIIVVLNEEVDDGTDEIASHHSAKVFRESWKGHVAQKNSAAGKASQPWILGLDADEAVSPELQREIAQLFARLGAVERCAAYSFPRCTFYLGRWIRHGDWYPDRKIRLWQRGRAEWSGIDPHDKLKVNGAVGRLRGDLLHYSMESLEHQLAKTITYANDFVRECELRGRRVGRLDLAVRPAWRFLRSYLLRRGFCDGWQGFAVAWMTAFYTFLRYVKAFEAQSRPPVADER